MTTNPPRTRRTRTLQECADEIGVSIQQARAWRKSGELPARWVGNKWLVLDTALQRFIASFDSGAA
jgi:predicted site-specific integrase-resolvase